MKYYVSFKFRVFYTNMFNLEFARMWTSCLQTSKHSTHSLCNTNVSCKYFPNIPVQIFYDSYHVISHALIMILLHLEDL